MAPGVVKMPQGFRPGFLRLGGYILNLFVFYSYRLIGKLTVFLQFQEFSYLDVIDAPSRLRLIRKATTLARRFPVFEFMFEKNAVRRWWKNPRCDYADGTPEATKNRSVSR